MQNNAILAIAISMLKVKTRLYTTPKKFLGACTLVLC